MSDDDPIVTPLDEMTVEDLRHLATEANIAGRSAMNKDELVAALREVDESEDAAEEVEEEAEDEAEDETEVEEADDTADVPPGTGREDNPPRLPR